jgi:hypothetical protein
MIHRLKQFLLEVTTTGSQLFQVTFCLRLEIKSNEASVKKCLMSFLIDWSSLVFAFVFLPFVVDNLLIILNAIKHNNSSRLFLLHIFTCILLPLQPWRFIPFQKRKINCISKTRGRIQKRGVGRIKVKKSFYALSLVWRKEMYIFC